MLPLEEAYAEYLDEIEETGDTPLTLDEFGLRWTETYQEAIIYKRLEALHPEARI